LQFSAGQPQFLRGKIGNLTRLNDRFALNLFNFGLLLVRNPGKRADCSINPTDPRLSQGFQRFKEGRLTFSEISMFPHVTTPSLRETTVHFPFSSTTPKGGNYEKIER